MDLVGGQLTQLSAEKTISLLVAVRKLIRLQHQHCIWQVIEYLSQGVTRLFSFILRDEELSEYGPDKVDNTENDHPPHRNLKHHQSAAILRKVTAEAEEYCEAEGGEYVIHEKIITKRR